MGQLTVRKVPDELVRALKIRAARHGRSAEAEHRLILEEALGEQEEEFWSIADRLRARTAGTPQTDSAVIVRRMRDER